MLYLDASVILALLLEAAREEVRGSETVCEEEGTALDRLENLITPLSARQLQAINLLSLGKSVTSVAKTLGVGVSSIHRWKASHPLFKAELAQQLQASGLELPTESVGH